MDMKEWKMVFRRERDLPSTVLSQYMLFPFHTGKGHAPFTTLTRAVAVMCQERAQHCILFGGGDETKTFLGLPVNCNRKKIRHEGSNIKMGGPCPPHSYHQLLHGRPANIIMW